MPLARRPQEQRLRALCWCAALALLVEFPTRRAGAQRTDVGAHDCTTAQQRRAALLSPWRAVADESGELWEQIRQQDALEYRARHRISPDEIAAPASCPAQSVCGVWAVEPAAAKGEGGEMVAADKIEEAVSTCVDLCVGKVFLPPADALVRSREEAEDAAAFQQLLFDLQFPPPPPPPGGGRDAGGALADADGAARAGGSGDGRGVFADGGGGGGDSSTDAEASVSGEAALLRPAASPLSGFGVTMVYAAHNLAKAASAARIWAPTRHSLDVWTSERWCGEERNWGCYFLPPSNISIEIHKADGQPRQLDAEREGLYAGIDGIAHDFAPPHLAHYGTMWLQAQCLSYIWQPNTRTQAYLHEIRSQMGRIKGAFEFPFQHLTIGMHIRRGDSFMAARWMPGLETFLEEARRMKERYAVRHIFLSTDCDDTARACAALEEFECTTLPLERGLYDVGARQAPEHNPTESAYDQWIERRIQLGEVDGSVAALHAIAEIDTLASCDFIVGRLDSAISRLALMLLSARRGPRPFVSLDKPWAQPPFALIN